MPLRTLLARSATGTTHRRHSSITDDTPISQDGVPSPARGRADSMKRLSLGLSGAGEDTFNPFPNHDAEKRLSHQSAAPSSPVEDSPQRPKTASVHAATTMQPDEPGKDDTQKRHVDDITMPKPQRFSLLGFRHASDPQLFTRFRQHQADSQPFKEAAPPQIITTAPTTQEFGDMSTKRSKRRLFPRAPSPFRKTLSFRNIASDSLQEDLNEDKPEAVVGSERARVPHGNTFERLRRSKTSDGHPAHPSPPAYGDESTSSLAIPVTRLSDSSRSDDSSGSHRLYAKTTTTHTISTTTTFFKLKRRKKDKGPLFPLPEKFARPDSGRTSISNAPDANGGRKSMSPSRRSTTAVRFDTGPSRQNSAGPSPTQSAVALTNAPFGQPGPTIVRQDSTWSTHSGQSTPSVNLGLPTTSGRGRSSTMSSLGRSAERMLEAQPGSARTSTSTTGRRSFGDLLSLPHRLRQNSAPPTRNGTTTSPGTPASKSNSMQLSREPEPSRVYPQREDGDTPASYLEKLEAAVSRGTMATILCKSADEFSKTCLRKYMRGFSYFGESIDMAIRKMLMEVELPKETQQIDRLLAGFADRYYECNPGIFGSSDEAAFVAFSILLLHSDTHNKNNKRKMQKHDYVKNTQQGPVQISSDILDCFYDNVCYTPFIHFEDDVAINSHRLAAPRRKTLIRTRSSESFRGPVDPYTLILDNKLEVLRPPLKDVIDTEDGYSSSGTAAILDYGEIHKAFVNSAVLQLVSARSRPDAFLSQATISNPNEGQAGLVSIKVAKVGLLWRKDAKKKKAKRPWQEWGAILTDSKLYFFKDVGWVKKLISQFEAHTKSGTKPGYLTFKPPLSSFEPDALMSMDDAVALMDASYKRHKNAFTFIKHGGFEEVFLANSEHEMNDWIGKLNYAATFRTVGVRMRGLLGGNHDGRHLLQKDSTFSVKGGQTLQKDRRLDLQTAWEIMYYRRQLVNEKISDFDEKISVAQKELENLLRNARHLLILMPIQQKTREQLMLAAGRMSAKLKWTRVEIWRTKTHREILAKDLEEEGGKAFPAPRPISTSTSTPLRTTPLRISQPTLGRTMTDTSHATLSPISVTSSRTSNLGDRLKPSENEGGCGESSIPEGSSSRDPTLSAEHPLVKAESSLDSHSLVHQASTASSRLSLDKERLSRKPDESEEQVLRDAGLVGVDSDTLKSKRHENSESEKDRRGTISAGHDTTRTQSVRRSLHRSLREGHHHTPSIHRHRKGRDSGSSVAGTEDGNKSVNGESEELKRGTGSFILHGKKASVITMSSEWESMSNEERLKMRKAAQEGLVKDKPPTIADEEGVDEDQPPTIADHDEGAERMSWLSKQTLDHYGSPDSSRKPSIATTDGEHFVDAETGDNQEETREGE
ncbi:hypothetical protein EDD37DRAFT_384634 [Exophiala viscosa]|uniref:uncharacterized protein n=1 Tax=Exophiala viscosa TaxID=2486360 RepID=UPI002190FC4B|nr:hypothetical protein EDD37DRAFT_384634 [Exophiala viscosa]